MSVTRRVVLKTIGVGCIAAACTAEEDGAAEGTATMCGGDLCISIADNSELANVGGGLLFLQAPGHKIYVVRTSSGFAAVTAICTHAQCVIVWDGSSRYECPCHGSQFAADGAVLRAPAIRALRLYMTELAGDTLTVKLA